MPKAHIKSPIGDKFLYAVVYTMLIIYALIILYPVIYILSASFSDSNEVMRGRIVLWPIKPNLDGYRAVFSHIMVLIGFRNTFFYTIAGTLINVCMTLMCAYPLSRRELPFRPFFTLLFIFPMFFSGGIVPLYLQVNALGLNNTIWAVLLIGALSTYNMLITRTFFTNTVPSEILEASKIDGCSDIRYFFKILLPLSPAVIAVITLYYAVSHWNAYFNALIYLRNKNLQPLQLVLRNILLSVRLQPNELVDPDLITGKTGMEFLLKYALIVVSSAPIIAFYPFVQKYFMRGVMLGAIKG